MPKTAVAISGGVDSTLSASLLKEQGHSVTGVYFKLWQTDLAGTAIASAKRAAEQLSIPLKIINLSKQHKDLVVDYLTKAYQQGLTPNPCIICNKEIKFGLFFDWAMKNKFDYLATGHYAQIGNSIHAGKTNQDFHVGVADLRPLQKDPGSLHMSVGNLRPLQKDPESLPTSIGNRDAILLSATDPKKDQTYFLYLLDQKKLAKIIFPIGHLLKTQVRAEAKKRGLKNHDLQDSENICFLKNTTLKKFLLKHLGEKEGNIIDQNNNILGTHQGLWFYTIGQRAGFNIDKIKLAKLNSLDKTKLPALYILNKNSKTNELVIGFEKDIYKSEFKIKNLHWINKDYSPKPNAQYLVRIRHQGQLIPCTLKNNLVQLDQPTKGISPGQSAVFYHELKNGQFECLGGGVISN